MSRHDFICHACRRKSQFTQQRTRMLFEARLASPRPPSDRLSRTYICEHCQAENEITQPTAFWAFIDADGP